MTDDDVPVHYVFSKSSRLYARLALGPELVVCNLELGGGTCCSNVAWNYNTAQHRQVAFDVMPHVSAFHSSGSAAPDKQLLRETADHISSALHSAGKASENTDDPTVICEAAIWDLLVLLFIDRGGRGGYIAERLSRWTAKHAQALGAGIPADCTQHYDTFVAEFRSSTTHFSPELEQLYWRLLQQCIAQGWKYQVEELLSVHWALRHSSSVSIGDGYDNAGHMRQLVEVLSVLLAKAPSYEEDRPHEWGSYQEYQNFRAVWLETCVQALEDGVPEIYCQECDSAGAALKVLVAGHNSADPWAVSNASPSSVHLLTALLVHVYPNTRLSPELLVILDYCVEQRPLNTTAHPLLALTSTLMKAAVDMDAPKALAACAAAGLCSDWLLAHAAALFGCSDHFADQLSAKSATLQAASPEAPDTVSSPKLLQHCIFEVPEYFMLQHVASVLCHGAPAWRLAMLCLDSCWASGEAAARTLVTSHQGTAGSGAVYRLANAGTDRGLAIAVAQLCRSLTMDTWCQGHWDLALRAAQRSEWSSEWQELCSGDMQS